MSILNKRSFFLILILLIILLMSISHSTLLSQEIDRSKIARLRWVGPGRPGTYEEYIASFPKAPFYIREIFKPEIPIPEPRPEVAKILVIVNSSVYSELEEKIDRYVQTLTSFGYYVELYESDGGTPEDLKSFIKARESDLIGCVFIGSLPAAWYEVANDFDEYGPAEFPCDLFFMDLDGSWTDSDFNGRYDAHSDDSGDVRPEIFVGRIDASQMSGNEYEILSSYFDKNYNYWSGAIYLLKYGLTYTEDDWEPYDYFKHDISYLYSSDYEAIAAPDTDRDDYLNNRLKNIIYEFIQLACHSYSGGHYFTRGGYLFSDDIRYAPPEGLGYNLFCCSALRFTDSNFLGGAYIFNEGEKALVTIGSTKTGSMLEFHYFYESLGNDNPIGTAFKEWFEQIGPWDIWLVYWHYGMAIVGDPMVSFLRLQPVQTISGSVKTSEGSGIEGVELNFSEGGGITNTASDGTYSHDVPYDWSGTVIPGKKSYCFNPPYRDYSNVITDQSEQDYTGYPLLVAINNLISDVNSIIDDYSLMHFEHIRLTKPLNQAKLYIINGKHKKAIRILRQFKRVVKSLSSGRRSVIPPADAAELIADADELIKQLGYCINISIIR